MDDIYETLEDLEKRLSEELKKIAKKGDISPVEVDNATKALCLMLKIKEYTEGESYDRESSMRSYRNSYNNRSRNSMRRSHSNRRSYENEASTHSITDRMVDKLESMMDEASSQYERDTISDWINYLENK